MLGLRGVKTSLISILRVLLLFLRYFGMLSAFTRSSSDKRHLSSNHHLLAAGSSFERMDEIFSSPSSNDSFRDGSSVIECTPNTAEDGSLYIDTKCQLGTDDSASSPLSSLNVTPTYSFRPPSVGDDAAMQLSAESERVDEQSSNQKSLKSVQQNDEDDDVEMIFHDQHSLDFKMDASLKCVMCLMTTRNGRFINDKYCSESCASISSFAKK